MNFLYIIFPYYECREMVKEFSKSCRNTTQWSIKYQDQIAGKEETTQMFKIAICDDESLFTEELRELISGYMMEKGLDFEIDTYSSGEALIELRKKFIACQGEV